MQRELFNSPHQVPSSQQVPIQRRLQPYPTQNIFTNTNFVQPHFMPEPTAEAWNVQAMPWKLATTAPNPNPEDDDGDGVMQFQATFGEEFLDRRLHHHLNQKRKSDILPEHPPKQFISEERFTAHFNGLHISSDFVNHTVENNSMPSPGILTSDAQTKSGVCFTNRTYQDYKTTARELEEKLLKANRITICDEVKKLYEEQNKMSFLPEALMNRRETPCRALVLWQPSPLNVIKSSPFLTEMVQRKDNTNTISTMYNDKNEESARKMDMLEDYDINSSGFQDVEIDDYIDNNNTSSLDFNNFKQDGMDEDL